MNQRNFFAELKRRNVYKVAVAYAIVGWLLIQIATQVFPFLEISNWVVRLVIALVAIGFPVALIIAWAFELTPQGIKRTEDVAPEPRRKSYIWICVVIVGALLSVGLFYFGRYTATNSTGTSGLTEKSIAVLPFVNMSSDKEQDYFSDGLSEESLNQLAQIPQLRVIARTSSFSFKGKEVDVATIAKALNVANVLEGSVRKSANTLRITAQLVRTTDSSHLWSQTYDR